jgi:hypothetical protein
MDFYFKLQILQFLVSLLTCIVGSKLFKEYAHNKNELKLIFTFCILDIVTSTYFIILYYYDLNNLLFKEFQSIYIWAEIILLPLYINKTIRIKHSPIAPIVFCLILSIISLVWLGNTYAILQAISGIYISYHCFVYLTNLFKRSNTIDLSTSPSFWIVIGIITCYTASIPACLAILYLFIVDDKELFSVADPVFYYFMFTNIIMHIFFIKAFTCKSHQPA